MAFIKDLDLVTVLGNDFRIPVDDITSNRPLAVRLATLLSWMKSEEDISGKASDITIDTIEGMDADDVQEALEWLKVQKDALEKVISEVNKIVHGNVSGTVATEGQVLTKGSGENDVIWADPQGGISDAPSDDKEYVRKNAAWIEGSGMSTEDKEKLDAYPTYAELLKIITDNEKVAAAAIKDLNDRLAAIEGESLYILAD